MGGTPSFDHMLEEETDICLIVEGCYPHVTGGVASWIDWLMRNLPQYSFSVVAIVSGDEPREAKYAFPPNLFRFAELDLQGPKRSRFSLPRLPFRAGDAEAVEAIADILTRFIRYGRLDTLKELIAVLDGLARIPTHDDLTRSEFSWRIVCAMYRRLMPQAAFLDFFWAWRSLVGGLFATITFPLPAARTYHAISTGYAGLLAARAASQTGCRALITEHGIYTNERRIEILMADWIVDTVDNGLSVEDRRLDIRDLWIMAFESYARACYEACETITTLYGDNQKLQSDLGAEAGRLKVIPNGIDVDRFGSVERERGTQPTIALIGRVVPIKDVKTFIAAAAIARASVPGLRALVLGPLDEDIAYADECRQMIDDLGVGDTVILQGRVNVLEWLPRIDVMVLSSLSEAQPLTVLEAGAAGIPCVTTNVGSCREILYGAPDEEPSCGVGGVVTDVVSPGQIAQGVVGLLGDDALRREMGANLRARVRRFYSSERSRDAYACLYGDARAGREMAPWPG